MPTDCPLVALRRNRTISHSAEHLDLSRYVHGPHSCEPALRQRGYRRVLASRSAQRPALARAERAEPYRAEILALYESCKGNLCACTQSSLRRARGCPLPR
jgi:hypothetical protein